MKVTTKKKGRKRINQEAFNIIESAGSKLVMMPKRKWKLATPPGAHILRKYLKKEYEVRTLEDETGWLIKRI